VTSSAPGTFEARDITIAVAVALLAQLAFLAAFSLPTPALVQAEISNDNAQPIAVAITPVLRLGSKTPTKAASMWERKRPVAAKAEPRAALPSPQAAKTPEAIPTTAVPDASVAPTAVPDAGHTEPNLTVSEDAGMTATASSVQGSEQGAIGGTETDPLKAHAVDMYRAQLQAWFAARFEIRGKVPFETLKTLRGSAVVNVGSDRKVTGFTIAGPSGNADFDRAIESTLAHIQSSGVELPAPPPLYDDVLGSSLPVAFRCNVASVCE
jgi:hypothetical protein